MKRPIALAFTLVITISWCVTGTLLSCAQSETEQFERAKQEGLESYRSGDLQKAERKLFEAGKIAKSLYGDHDPKYKDTLENLALVYEAQGHYAKARKVLKAVGGSSISDDGRIKTVQILAYNPVNQLRNLQAKNCDPVTALKNGSKNMGVDAR